MGIEISTMYSAWPVNRERKYNIRKEERKAIKRGKKS